MSSSTDICNLALTRARVGTIGDINERSAEAEKCRILYPLARDHLLEVYSWRFAKQTKALALTGTTPTEWLYEYDYPNDCLRVLYVIPPGVGQAILKNYSGTYGFEPTPYEVGSKADGQSRSILCNIESAYIAYTKRVENTDLFSEQFKQALSWYMAADLSLSFGGDSGVKLRDTALNEYKLAIAQATAHDANQARQRTRQIPRSIAVRGDGGSDSHYYDNGAFYRRF